MGPEVARIKRATDLPLIVFQYANELAYDLDTLVTLTETIQLRTPDEKDKRHGQAVAAASLPAPAMPRRTRSTRSPSASAT